MDFRQVEEKWQKKWAEEGLFESKPEGENKFYLTAAFPYPNSPQHIGHARTYTTTDVYARYKRMKGHNVLLPMGFHVTGTPVLAMAKRVKEADPEVVDVFRDIYGIPAETIPTLDTPEKLVGYFSKEIESGMREMGFSIDWRRKFYTYDLMFNRFIQWQFRKLKEKGYITKGSHPVPWCPSCNNAMGAHDTKGDVDPQIEEVVLIKFKLEDGSSVLCSTYRPETTYGVTNVWIHPGATYLLVELNGEKYWISKEVHETLKMQLPLKIIGEKKGSEFCGKTCENPLNGKQVPIFPATFVSPHVGSGIVMSVPAHAPYDYLALMDLKGTGYEKQIPELVQVLEIDGYGNFPAKEICEKLGIKNQEDPKAEDATHEIYKKEAHTGKMVVGEYAGKPVIEAKEKIQEDMISGNKALMKYEIASGPVHCRCGAVIGVNLVEDQWFIDYGNPAWKEKVKECFEAMSIIPEKTKPEYYYTIDWLKEKACTRAQGLGTRFPFDETKMIEALSDSTIYMSFYTISHILKEADWEKIDDAVFDYALLGEGDAQAVADKLGIPKGRVDEMRKEFDYWYPMDSRHSAGDLIHNHLTFLIFNHVAIFPKPKWPRQIVVNGFVLMDGKKMSKSMGNILPLRKAIRKYGADVVRFSVVSGAELSADSDFNRAMAEGVSSRIRYMMDLIEKGALKGGEKPLSNIDKWLLSNLHSKIERAEKNFQVLGLREVSQDILYNTVNELKWYFKRTEGNPVVLEEYFDNWVRLVSPFMPHVADEMWEQLGKSGLASKAQWPTADQSKIDDRIGLGEELVEKTRDDVENIQKITGKTASKITLFVSDDWKRKLRAIVHEEKNVKGAMAHAMRDEDVKAHAKKAQKLVLKLVKQLNLIGGPMLSAEEEYHALTDAKGFLSKEFNGARVDIKRESEATGEAEQKKAENAMPMKPSILIE